MARVVAEEDAAAAQEELERAKKQAAEQETETKVKAAEVVSKANKYACSPLPKLKEGKAGSACKSMRRFLSAKESGQYTAEQCVSAISEQYSRSKLFCSPECRNGVCKATGLCESRSCGGYMITTTPPEQTTSRQASENCTASK
jgi:regulator of protease activity HflC (stomatin/prohibitin superfamily)